MLRERLQRSGYLADADLATTVWLASALQRPLLLEGDAGVGKTALATALAQSQSPISRTPPKTHGAMPSGTAAIRRLNP